MKLYRRIDTNTGLFIEDVLLDRQPILTQTVTQTITNEQGLPQEVITEQAVLDAEGNTIPDPQYIDTPCPGGFYLPRWDGTQWVEGGTTPELVPQEPTLEDRTKALEDAMLTIMMGGM